MSHYDPDAHTHELGVEVLRQSFPSPHNGLYIPRLHTIYLQPGLHPHLERCVLAHELVHAEQRTKHTHGNREQHRIIENRCDRLAACRLITFDELAEQITTVNDHGEAAYNLRVTGRIYRARMHALTDHERRRINHRLFHLV